MEHLDKWERSRGHTEKGEEIVRNVVRIEEVVLVCDVFEKVCKS